MSITIEVYKITRWIVYIVQSDPGHDRWCDEALVDMVGHDLQADFSAALKTVPVINKGGVRIRDVKLPSRAPMRVVQTHEPTLNAIEHDHILSETPTEFDELKLIHVDTRQGTRPLSLKIKACDLEKVLPLEIEPMREASLEGYRTKVLPGLPPQIIIELKRIRDIYTTRDPRCAELTECMIWRMETAISDCVENAKYLPLVAQSIKDDILRMVRREFYRHYGKLVEQGCATRCEIAYREGVPVRLTMSTEEPPRRWEPTLEELAEELDRIGRGDELFQSAVRTLTERFPGELKPSLYVEYEAHDACLALLKLAKRE